MRFSAVVLSALFVLSLPRLARADDCPPGSIYKTVEGYSWCEPTVCMNDGQCKPDEVCRPVPLCMQVGTLTADAATLAEAGQRLVATQRCAPDKTCPQTTICSDLGRCLSRPAADKMGLLAAPAASAGGDPATKKSACGCRVPGDARPPHEPLVAGALLVLLATTARLRRRART